jgi:hypothetical protein
MKFLTLQHGGEWVAFTPPTREQRVEMQSATSERRAEIVKSFRKPADAADVAIAQPIYEKHRIEGSYLIACDIRLPEGSGIINCRVDGEHKQIRF